MKKLLKIMLTLSVCIAAMCLTAAAVGTDEAPARVWGQVSPWDGNGIFLKNSNEDDLMNEVVVHLGEAPVVDAATGLPLSSKDIKEGDTLYAWIGPAATMSLPPQVSAIVAVGNVPADAAVPEYCVISGEAVLPAMGEEGPVRFPLLGGENLEVTDETVYTPWLTRQIVRMEDLIPGARVLVWKDKDGAAEKVLVFPYGCQGYVSVLATMHDVRAAVNGGFDAELDKDVPQFSCKRTDKGVMAPIRAIAEAAGYEVRWDKTLGVVVSLNGETVFSIQSGSDVIVTPEGESGLSAPCLKEGGTTYLPLEDLCYWLNLYLSKG